MSLTYTEMPDAPVFEIAVEGHVSTAEFDEIAPRIEALIARHGSVRMVEVVDRFPGFDPGLIAKGIAFDIRNIRHISHCAVVTDSAWIGPVTRMVSAMIPTTLRVFATSELEAARAWARDPAG